MHSIMQLDPMIAHSLKLDDKDGGAAKVSGW
jgi:hypothetical protein